MSKETQTMSTNGAPRKSALAFFFLTLLLSAPLWLIGAFVRFIPGLPFDLPFGALQAVTPVAAAVILVWHADGREGVARFLRRAMTIGAVDRLGWYAVALVFVPLVYLVAYAIQSHLGTAPSDPIIPLADAPLVLLLFLIPAATEEIGEQGYAYPALAERRNALAASLILGAAWALWHVVPDIQAGRALSWILWFRLGTVAFRVIIVWLYVNTGGSVVVAILFHGMLNVATFLYPNHGSHYDPFLVFVVLGPAVVAIVFLYGAALTPFRYRR